MPARPSGLSAEKSRGDRPLRSPSRLILAIVLFWVALIHASGIFGVFVLDDQFALVQNGSLLDFWNFKWFSWTGRPVTMATFAGSFTILGPSPFSCHLVNIAIHVASVAVFFMLVSRSLGLLWPQTGASQRASIAGSAALLWGVHPLSTAAVTYIVQRAESLASLFMLAAVLAWSVAFSTDSRATKRGWAVGSVALAYLAYGSKEMSVGLPLIILLYDRVVLAQAWRPLLGRAPWYAALVLPLFVGATTTLPDLLRESHGRSTVGFNVQGFSSWEYFTSQPRVLLEYLRLSVLPVHQTLDYGWLPPRDRSSQLLGLVAWIAVAAALLWLWKKARPIALLALSALLVLAPTSTLMPLQDIIFEHRFYLPLACLVAAVVGWCGSRGLAGKGTGAKKESGKNRAEHSKGHSRYWLRAPFPRTFVAAMVLAIPLSIGTMKRNLDYSSRERIHVVDVRRHPGNPRAWHALALSAPFQRPEPKIEMLRRAIELSQARDFYYAGTAYALPRDLADTLFNAGRISESLPYYEMALPHSNSEVQRTHVLFQLAMIASIEGRIDDAERLFQQTLAGDAGIREQVRIVYAAHRERVGQIESQQSARVEATSSGPGGE